MRQHVMALAAVVGFCLWGLNASSSAQETKTETPPASSPTALFPDKSLEAAVRSLVYEKKNDPSKPLTEEDLTKIYLLEAKGKGIRDLAGLEKCVNLQLIDLANNEISDLTPIKNLKTLQSLTLANNKITDLTPIAGIAALQYLEASGNQIRNLPPLEALTKLSALYLADNKISDATPVAPLAKLSSLDLSGNQIACAEGIEELKGLSLLKLSGNKIKDVEPIAANPPSSMLLLEKNKIKDLSPLVEAAKADAAGKQRFAPFLRLYLEGNPLSDAAKNDQLTALKSHGVRIMDQDGKPTKKAPGKNGSQGG